MIKKKFPIVHSQNAPVRGWLSTHFLHMIPSHLESAGLGGQGGNLGVMFSNFSTDERLSLPASKSMVQKSGQNPGVPAYTLVQ